MLANPSASVGAASAHGKSVKVRMDISSKSAIMGARINSSTGLNVSSSNNDNSSHNAHFDSRENDSYLFLFAACRGDMEQVKKMMARYAEENKKKKCPALSTADTHSIAVEA